MTMSVLSDASPPSCHQTRYFFFYYHPNRSCGFILFVLYASSINLTKNLDLGMSPLSLSILNKISCGREIPNILLLILI
jgi:hypothetical protein